LQLAPLPPLEPTRATASLARLAPTKGEKPEQHLDDGPMFVPSTWLRPASHEEDRWFRQQMPGVVFGLIAALALVVPTLLWLGGWLAAPRKHSGGEALPAAVKPAPLKAIANPERSIGKPKLENQHDARNVPRSTATEAADKPIVNSAAPESAGERVVREAKRRIENADVVGARDLLTAAGSDPQGLVPYALGETYDPNVLAAWGTRDITPDVAKAKVLYGEALDLGNARARRRLDELQ
jgi:hypothetical protein